MQIFYLIPGFQSVLAVFTLIVSHLFIAPQLFETRLGLATLIASKNPAALEKFQTFFLFRISEISDMVFSGVTEYLFIIIPLLAILSKLMYSYFQTWQNKMIPFLISLSASSFFLVLVIVDLLILSINAVILIPFAMKFGG
ncbi:MAG: hypothetical protein PHV05_07670 [Candidatus Riflebacteria bacterium]|nr:hypothetical protein [Candidatus Riflebacteria bacterium]